MTKEQEKAIEILEKIDVKFFISGMAEQKDYIIDKADEVNVAIEIVLSMIEEKDKIIDLMSEQLTTPMHDKEWVKEYFENKADGGNER